MITKMDKNAIRKNRHDRLRFKLSGTTEIPRLDVYRSLNHIYCQIIDDINGTTLVACSTNEKEIASKITEMTKVEQSKFIGKVIAERALAKGVVNVVFDRGGYLYTGRVAALADGAREAGLKF